MVAITQRIPDFFGGINEAPDQYKGQGQVRDACNCIPDLTRGLYKRPGAKRIGTAALAGATTSTHWFHYYRDETEGSYIGQIQTDGSVNMWSCETGNAITVTYESGQETDLKAYLAHGTPSSSDLQFTTINDSTFVCNRKKTVEMHPTSAHKTAENPHTYVAFVEVKQVINGRQYALNIHDPASTATTQISSATFVRVNPSGQGYTVFNGNRGHCPHIGTKIYGISSGAPNSGLGYNGTVTNGGVAQSGRNNLIFRLTVTGQQGPVPGANDQSPESDDYTCSYNAELTLLHGGEGWLAGDTFTVSLEGKSYPITIDDAETSTIKASLAAVRPTPTPFDQQTSVSVDTILGGIQAELPSGISSEIVGNGLYLYSNTQNFNVTTPNTDLLTVVTESTNDVTNLPFQAKNGYILKVANSAANEDDYYLRFDGDNNSDGPGSWSECAKPGITKKLKETTMPIVIQRTANGNFNVKQFTYADREVGDDNTNPEPSFVDGKVNKVLFFRNRLVFLSGDNVVLSRPGDLGNFFVKTALTVAADDPIDISCSSTYPSELFDGLEQNTGLIVFAKNQQFLLATDSDVLQPESAKLGSISTYNYNAKMAPISMGTIAGFVDNAGAFSRFFTMANIAREGEPQVNELSKVVSRKLSNDLDMMANSRENNFVFFGKRDSKEVFAYRYFGSLERQLQSAWFRWEHTRPIKYHCVTDDTYFFVDDQHFLQKIDLIRDDELSFTKDSETYIVHLDNYVSAVGGNYDSGTNKTTFTLSWLSSITDKKPNLTAVKGGSDGTIINHIDVPNTGNTITVQGKWDGTTLYFGYDYTMTVELPTFFLQRKQGEKTMNEQRGSLVVHRANLNFSRVGVYETQLTRRGKPVYKQQFSSTNYDNYQAGEIRVDDTFQAYVPIYEKNVNFSLTIHSTSPLPATLTSMSWEGDYNPSYYKRV